MRLKAIILALVLVLSAGVSAYAGSVTFNFNSLSSGANSASITTYMDGVLIAAGCSGCSVLVTGAVADQTYNGEGYVVGNNGKSLTLGTSNDATSNSSQTPSSTYNTFLATTNDSSQQISTEITMQFSGFTINGSASFAYEIFPNGSCPVLNAARCGGAAVGGIYPNQPDFEFKAGTSSTQSPVTSFGTNGFQYGVTPSATGSDGSSTTGPNGTIVAPQYIGTWSTTTALNGDRQLDFIDWPATIGIDNLTISYTNTPEPASIALLGALVALLAKKLRRA